MKGMDLSEQFYYEYGAPMIHEQFPALEEVIVAALAGSGSECFGYDDELSQDHDFEPGFCLFLPSEDIVDRKTAFALERAYAKLPMEFMGYRRERMLPVGGNRHGVIRMSDFFMEKTGSPDGDILLGDWFFLSEQLLAESTNGKVFRDDTGIFTGIRARLSYMPEDVRLKKLAGNLLLMGQSGQYNYSRAMKRGETAAAQLAAFEFVKSAVNVVFLINKHYVPYYKWTFRALRELPILSQVHQPLEYLISSGNTAAECLKKQSIMEETAVSVVLELERRALTDFCGEALEGHAYSVNHRISDSTVRNYHILYAV